MMVQNNFSIRLLKVLVALICVVGCCYTFHIKTYAWSNSSFVDKGTIGLADSKTDSISETIRDSQKDGDGSTTHYYKVTREYPGFLNVSITATMQGSGKVAVSVRDTDMRILYEKWEVPDDMHSVTLNVAHYLDAGDYYICIGNAYDGYMGAGWSDEKSKFVYPGFTYTVTTMATRTTHAIDRQNNDSAEFAQYFDHYKESAVGAFIYGTDDECDYYKINKTDTNDMEVVLHYFSSNMGFSGLIFACPKLKVYDSGKTEIASWPVNYLVNNYDYYSYYKVDEVMSGLEKGIYYICVVSGMNSFDADGVYKLNIVSKTSETNNGTSTNNSQPATTESVTTKPATTKPATTESATTGVKANQPTTQAVKEYNYIYKPQKTKIYRLQKVKKGFNVSWDFIVYTPEVGYINGYQIKIATNKKFTKNVNIYTVKDRYKTYKKIRKLKSKKRYYVKVRAYKIENGKKYYADWSRVKSIKTK